MPGRPPTRLGPLQLTKSKPELRPRRSFLTSSFRASPAPLSRHIQNIVSQISFASRSSFCTSSRLLKKKKAGSSNEYDARSTPSAGGNTSQGSVDDFSELQSKIDQQVESLRETLTRVSASGGRGMSPEMLERISVEVKTSTGKKTVAPSNKGGASKEVEKVKLGDLATVLPRGQKMLVVVVHDVAHKKAVFNALLTSSLSITPVQPATTSTSSSAANEIHILLPPPTTEARTQVINDSKAALEKGSESIRGARAQWQKIYRQKERAKTVRADELVKAHKEMEKVVEKGQAGLKGVWDAWRKRVEG